MAQMHLGEPDFADLLLKPKWPPIRHLEAVDFGADLGFLFRRIRSLTLARKKISKMPERYGR